MKAKRDTSARVLFRLDFALRGHAAYIQPATLDDLIQRVERTSLELGAPLLCHLDRRRNAKAASSK